MKMKPNLNKISDEVELSYVERDDGLDKIIKHIDSQLKSGKLVGEKTRISVIIKGQTMCLLRNSSVS